MSIIRLCALVAALLAACLSRSAFAGSSTYVLAIGHNGLPHAPGAGEVPLRYADDDAAAFYQFTKDFARESWLLTVMDADTQARFPREVDGARAPTLSELRARVKRLRQLLDDDRQRGDASEVFIFYSGHGSRPNDGAPSLTLLDTALTHDILYDEILEALPARSVHLFIDACYAEAVVRPRDAEAVTVDVTPSDIARYAARATLERFPNVGTIVAASISSQTHEWDAYRHGVFTQELLSGLRGGADVNVDGVVEYSELYAFLTAANRNIGDARARSSVIARPPASNGRVPIVNLARLKSTARIDGIPASAGHVFLEDELGNRLADVHVESGARLALSLPAEKRMFVRCLAGEGELLLHADQTMPFERIALEPPAARVRGALDVAMKRGLFTIGFGPNYYRGFIDKNVEFVSVPIEDRETATQSTRIDDVDQSRLRSRGGQSAAYFAAGVSEGVGHGLGPMMALRTGLRSASPTGFLFRLDGAWRDSPSFSEWRILGSVGYALGVRRGALDAFAALSAGGGVVAQAVPSEGLYGGRQMSTGAFAIVPTIGVWYRVWDRFAVGSEADVTALVHRRDSATTVSILPGAYLGCRIDL